MEGNGGSRLRSTAIALSVSLVLMSAIFSTGSSSRAGPSPPRPNVVVIETDDQTVESMRVMPNVNHLIGDQGAAFANSFVNYSLCCPSRATFLTGQYAHNHGVLTNTGPLGGFKRFESLHAHDNLAVWLRHAGYYTAMVGKYLNGYKNRPAKPPGWTEWHAVAPDDQKVYDYTLNNNRELAKRGHRPADFKQDVLTDKAVYFLNRRALRPQPFFLWLTYTAPHIATPSSDPNPPTDCQGAPRPAPRDADAFDSEPLPMPPNFNEADVSDKPASIRALPLLDQDQIAELERKYRCQLESLLSVDDGVRRVIDALRAKGALDNTLIIYTSDNGYFNGEHRLPRFKNHVYEESIRVPLEIRGPGIPRGVTLNPPVINADLAPTIVDAAKARPGLAMDGRSLLPIVNAPDAIRNRELLIEQPPRGESSPSFVAIRTRRYLYAEHSTGETELYDLQQDPFELSSLHDDPAHAKLKARLANHLHRLQACAGADCLRSFKP